MVRYYVWIIACSITANTFAQSNAIASFDLDDCSVTDQTGNFMDGEIRNMLSCECGVGENSSSLYFDGSGDTIIMDQALKDIFRGDFSVSFYLWLDQVSEVTSIMSVQGNCSSARDSAFFVRYFPTTNEIDVELSKNFGEFISLRANLPEDNCWNHILFTREGQVYSLYLNGQFIERFTFLDEVFLGKDFPFLIGSSPCVGTNEQFLSGRIDELRFYDRALKTDAELLGLQEFPDQILSPDTTIFEGSSFVIRNAASCAANISWSPQQGLDDPFALSPLASPQMTTEYTIEYNHGTCIARDRIVVSVLSENEIRCGNILLPKAFTPNNDGLNEEYGISNAFIIDELRRFEIYNKWGLKLFETSNKNAMWNGNYDNMPSPPGTYVFKIAYTCQDELYERTGTFNILK